MSSDIPRLGAQSRNLGSPGQGGVRSGDERKGGGQGQGKDGEPESSKPEEAAAQEKEQEHRLAGDTFAAKRQKVDPLDGFMEERLPWEVDRRHQLEELAKRRNQPAPPPRPPARPAPQTRPLTAPLQGRQVEGGYDPASAVDSTLRAHQEVRDKQPEEPAGREGGSGWLLEGAPPPDLAAPPAPRAPASGPLGARGDAPRRVGCRYRVVDDATGQPLAGARLEIEPVGNHLLPTRFGQTDAAGWHEVAAIQPGRYLVTVRQPGYRPLRLPRVVGPARDEAVFRVSRG